MILPPIARSYEVKTLHEKGPPVSAPVTTAEVAALMHYLAAQRESVLAIVYGLDEADLRRSVVPSGWTPLGLIEHLGWAEHFWVEHVLAGAAPPPPLPPDGAGGDLATNRPV